MKTMTHSDNVDKLVGNDGLTTTVVLELEGTHHVKSVLLMSTSQQIGKHARQDGKKETKKKRRGRTLEAFSMAVLLALISAA